MMNRIKQWLARLRESNFRFATPIIVNAAVASSSFLTVITAEHVGWTTVWLAAVCGFTLAGIFTGYVIMRGHQHGLAFNKFVSDFARIAAEAAILRKVCDDEGIEVTINYEDDTKGSVTIIKREATPDEYHPAQGTDRTVH